MEAGKVDVRSNFEYDEFEPQSWWTREPQQDILHIYLPGFKKEYLKVQVTSKRMIRAMGERPGTGNRRVRFQKEFAISSNVNIDRISARFEGTKLSIKLPKITPQGGETSTLQPATKPSPTRVDDATTQQQALPEGKAEADQKQKVQNGPTPPVEPAVAKQPPPEVDQQGKKATSDGLAKRATTSAEKNGGPQAGKDGGKSIASVSKKKETKDGLEGDGARVVDRSKGLQHYRELLSGLARETRTKRRVLITMVVFALLVLMFGVHTWNASRGSYFGGEHTEE